MPKIKHSKILTIIIILNIILIITASCSNDKSNSNKLIPNNQTNNDETEEEYNNIQDTGSLVSKPKHIENTIINNRPTQYQIGSNGGTFVLGDYNGDPKTFNIIVATEDVSLSIIKRFQISLMEYNEDTGEWFVFPGDHAKGDGKGYTLDMTDDGKEIMTIYLRDDVFWTDGVKMNADDWVWFWNNIYTDQYISPGGHERTTIVMKDGSKEKITAEYINQFEFRLIFPRPLGEPEIFADFSPMPKHILEPIYEEKTQEDLFTLWSIDTPLTEIVGNGPWILTKYLPNEALIFESNPKFFLKDMEGNNLPYLDKLIIISVLDQNTLNIKFVGGDLDTYQIQNSDFKQMVEGSEVGGYRLLNGGVSPDTEFVVFNQNRKSKRMKDNPVIEWFSKKEFRQAMSYLIDRKTIINQIHMGLAEPDSTYFSKSSPYFDPDIQVDDSYDPDRALTLLQSIGIRDRDGNGILEDDDENEIHFELNTNSGNKEREKTINSIVNSWKTYGINAFPSSIEFNVLVTRLTSSYDWDSVLISLENGLFPFNDNIYLSSGNLHIWNPKKTIPTTEWESRVDNLYLLAKYQPNFDIRKDLINDMFSILYDQLPMIPLVSKNIFRVVKNVWGNVNWDIWSEIGGYNNIRLFMK